MGWPRLILARFALLIVLQIGGTIGFAATVIDDYGFADLRKYAEKNRLDPKWRQPESHWNPYINKRFEDGLTPGDRRLSRLRQEAGDCDTVLTLEMKGFLALYPETSIDFHVVELRREFETEIVPAISPAYKRCRAHKLLIPVIEAEKRKWNLHDTYHITLPRVFSSLPNQKATPETLERLERVSAGILRLVVCDLHPPAFDDLAYLIEELKILHLLQDELRYIGQVAWQGGLSNTKLDRLIAEAERSAKSRRQEHAGSPSIDTGIVSANFAAQPGRLEGFCGGG